MARYWITLSCPNPDCISTRSEKILSAVDLDSAYLAANQLNAVKENRNCPTCGSHLTYYPTCEDYE